MRLDGGLRFGDDRVGVVLAGHPLQRFDMFLERRGNAIGPRDFQDLLDAPRELTDNSYRIIPGDGIAPVVTILRKLSEKRYTGALSVELFRPEYVNGDPFEVATEIRRKCEAVMQEAGVL